MKSNLLATTGIAPSPQFKIVKGKSLLDYAVFFNNRQGTICIE